MRFRNSAMESTLWLSESSVSARFSASGLDANFLIVISSNRQTAFAGNIGQAAVTRNLTLFDHNSSKVVMQPTTSSKIFVVLGNGLLAVDMSCKIKKGATTSESSRWMSDSALKSKTSASEYNWVGADGVVSIQKQLGKLESSSFSSSLYAAYGNWQNLDVEASVVPTSGSVNILLWGASLGVNDYTSLRCHLGFTAAVASTWNSDSSIDTKLSAGTGRIELLTISYGKFLRWQRFHGDIMQYIVPEISSLNAIDNRTLLIQGSFFGIFEPKQTFSWRSIHQLIGAVSTEVAVLDTSKIFKGGRVADFSFELLLENFSRIDGVTMSLVSPSGVMFQLIKNKCRGCYKKRIQFELSDSAESTIPYSKCVDGTFRFDHFPIVRELLLASDGDWKVLASAGSERDFLTMSLKIDIRVRDYLGLVDGTQVAVFETWSSDSGLSIIRGTLNAQKTVPNIIIGGQIGRNKAEPISAFYEPSLVSVRCSHFPETGTSMITVIGNDLAQAVFVGNRTWEGFERASLSAAIKTGQTSCESSPWRSQSSILCKTTGRPLADVLPIAMSIANTVGIMLFELPELGVA
jgi:hypothetical protein